jgi:ABC-type polysaccharide/polyol phosphate export permease
MLVRYAMATISGRTLELSALGGIAVKSLPWAFFVGTIGMATASLLSNMNLLTKIYFPREVLPFSTTVAQAFDSSIGLVVLLAILPFLGVTFAPTLLWWPVQLLCLFAFTLAAALFLSCANLFFRDVKYLVQVMLTFGIFITPVFIEPAMLGKTGAMVIMLVNPLAPILEGIRLSVIEGHNLLQPLVLPNAKGVLVTHWSPWYLLLQFGWASIGLLVSMRIFRRASIRFAEYI